MTLHSSLIDLGLDRMTRREGLLDKLGNPHLKLPPVVHVAGTNGKGSTLAFLRAMLEAAGYKVHVYTSPHLLHFNERIRLAGQLASDDQLQEALEEVERINAGEPITFFEITTVMAFLLFSRVPADIVLLETGMGGRLDATNIVPKPAVTLITRISKDHAEFLGDTLPAIAGEKAGIMKKGAPCIVAPQYDDSVLKVFEKRAGDIEAPLFLYGKDWHLDFPQHLVEFAPSSPFVIPDLFRDPSREKLESEGRFSNIQQAEPRIPEQVRDDSLGGVVPRDQFRFTFQNHSKLYPLPNLVGPHQIINAGLALACLEQLKDFPVSHEARCQGLTHTNWPGRLQRITEGALAEQLPEGWELWIDGAHNDSGAQVLAQQISIWEREESKSLVFIFALKSNRNVETFLPLLNKADQVFLLQTEDIQFWQAEKLQIALKDKIAAPVKLLPSLYHDYKEIILSKKTARILIWGSLYIYEILKRS